MTQSTGKTLIIIGLIIALVGFILYFGGNRISFLGKLPGDIRVEKENGSFYFPIVTCLVLSLLLTIAIKVVQWIMRL